MVPRSLTQAQHRARAVGYGLELQRKHREKVLDAETRCSQWLADGNAAKERGNARRAEYCYAKSQFWLDRYNNLVGNS